MITYQDLLLIGESDVARMEFVHRAINEHKSSELYLDACEAKEYAEQRNTTILQYQKLLYTLSGEAVPDNFSANYKLCSNFFYRFVTQQNQYLLGNGVTWGDPSTGEKLGDSFDRMLQTAGYEALVGAVSFGFWNLDHLEVFNIREFKPLYDEDNGALRAGIRFWQIDSSKPLRATLYEENGYTDYVWNRREVTQADGSVSIEYKGEIMHEKQPYMLIVRQSDVDGTEIYDGMNYPTFPIVPLWANEHKHSELVGLQQEIDAYDLIKSGFANDLDDASQIYWIIQNAGGMDDIDLAKFRERLKTVKAAVVDQNGAHAEAHTMDVPYAAREAMLDRLRSDMYDDYMALDTKNIASGAVTATQIQAAYEPMNNKADMYEYQIEAFLEGILKVAGIEDTPTFTRSVIVNKTEEIQTLTQAAQYLSEDYVTEKMLNLLGDGDKVDEILKEMEEDNTNRMPLGYEEGVQDGFGARANGQTVGEVGEENNA